MFHDYNPYETREEYIARKTRGDRLFARQVAADKAGRRKRVHDARVREHARNRRAHRN